MNETLGTTLVFSLGAVALFSFLAVASWADARRREREAYYRSEAIKKLAEMQGTVPDSVLQLVREALAREAKPVNPNWNPYEYRRERAAHYRQEMLNRIATMPGATAESVMEFLRNEERNVERRRSDGIRLGGMITTAAGVGLVIFLKVMFTDMPVYLAGLIPTFVGIVLIVFAEMGRGQTPN